MNDQESQGRLLVCLKCPWMFAGAVRSTSFQSQIIQAKRSKLPSSNFQVLKNWLHYPLTPRTSLEFTSFALYFCEPSIDFERWFPGRETCVLQFWSGNCPPLSQCLMHPILERGCGVEPLDSRSRSLKSWSWGTHWSGRGIIGRLILLPSFAVVLEVFETLISSVSNWWADKELGRKQGARYCTLYRSVWCGYQEFGTAWLCMTQVSNWSGLEVVTTVILCHRSLGIMNH